MKNKKFELIRRLNQSVTAIGLIKEKINSLREDEKGLKTLMNQEIALLISRDIYTTIELDDLNEKYHDDLNELIMRSFDIQNINEFKENLQSNFYFDIEDLIELPVFSDFKEFVIDSFKVLQESNSATDEIKSIDSSNAVSICLNFDINKLPEVENEYNQLVSNISHESVIELIEDLGEEGFENNYNHHFNLWIVTDYMQRLLERNGYETLSISNLNIFCSTSFSLSDDPVLNDLCKQEAYDFNDLNSRLEKENDILNKLYSMLRDENVYITDK